MNTATAEQIFSMGAPVTADSILSAYDHDGISLLPNFQGGYINFGYWENILTGSSQTLTNQDRINSSAALYNYILKLTDIKKSDTVLEVGCGLGLGATLAFSQYDPAKLVGIDLSPYHIQTARNHHLCFAEKGLTFEIANAEKTTLPTNSFDKIYSVEAIQHILDLNNFVNEIYRLCKPGGHVVLTAHLATSQSALDTMHIKDLLVHENIDCLTPIDIVISQLKQSGLKNIHSRTIGEHVFDGYELWLQQSHCVTPWSHNIYQAFKSGLIDYFVISADKLSS